MRHRTFVVFDDYANTGGIETDTRHNATLGEYDQLALHVVGDNASVANVTVNVYVAHSSDGRQWLYRSNNQASLPGTADVSITLNSTTDVEHKMWSDACLGSMASGPLLSFVRLHVVTVGGGAHVKIHATQRGASR
ncbi:MAG TPA: hypothetical protein VHB21_09460 [Minicystis sp.]|nr:hypothetical protein [Minicystis sp.]